MKFSKRRGFTLIELLLVVAIIVILASLVIVSVSKARMQGRDSKRIADLSKIQLAMEMYKDGHGGSYPSLPTSNWENINNTTVTLIATLITNLQPYLSPMPQDPITTTGTSYGYNIIGSAPTVGGYWLNALMEDPSNIPANYLAGNKCYQIWGGTAVTVRTGPTGC